MVKYLRRIMNLKQLYEYLLRVIKSTTDNSIGKRKYVIVFSADTNRIDEHGGPYKVYLGEEYGRKNIKIDKEYRRYSSIDD